MQWSEIEMEINSFLLLCLHFSGGKLSDQVSTQLSLETSQDKLQADNKDSVSSLLVRTLQILRWKTALSNISHLYINILAIANCDFPMGSHPARKVQFF